MKFIKTVESTKNYDINLYQYWATTVSSIVTTYGILNKNTGVMEIGPIQSLADARHFQIQLEAATYPEEAAAQGIIQDPNEQLDSEVKPH